MMRRDEVIKAIQLSGPAYVPIYFFNRDQDQSDIVAIEVQHHFMGPGKDQSEWGFSWERLDETMGQPRSYLIQGWQDLQTIRQPDPADPRRFAGVPEFMARYPDRFRMAALGLSGFTTIWCLRSFDALMLDLVDAPEQVQALAEIVFGFEERLIEQIASYPFDAVAFFDDWGTQSGMIISPGLWRRVFKPFYARQFALVHRLGMYVYFHCCGQYLPIIPDLIEVGVDVLNISQPNLYDIPDLGRRFGGQVCFICPVSYQTTSITGNREDIFSDVRELVDSLGRFNGGLLGYIEEYHSIGMSEENYQACVEAFRTLGVYQSDGVEGTR
jgi:uroporphyrinogen decarboxylase